MVNPLWLLPAVVAVVPAVAWLAHRLGGRGERVVARWARVLCGRFVSEDEDREELLEAAFVDTTYRTYAAKTYLFVGFGLVGGAVGGAYLVAGLLAVVQPLARAGSQLPNTISGPLGLTPAYEFVLADSTWWLVVLGGGLVLGVSLSALAYVLRWNVPQSKAEVRRRSIEEGLPRTVAFMYALSRGGMSVPDQLRTIGDNQAVYGETARETSIATREMDLFGRDVVSAVRRTAQRTPSEQYKTFAENLASVLQSGQSLSAFLRDQYDRFQEEAEARQDEVLELLGTIAEGYVTVLVAGTLFFITILLVFGLTTTDTLVALQLMAYVLIPLANAGFVVFLGQQLEALGIGQLSGSSVLDRTPVKTPPSFTDQRRTDGGVGQDDSTRRQLALYDRFQRVDRILRQPLRTFFQNPVSLLYLTVPLAVGAFLVRLPQALQAEGVSVRILDDLLIQSLLFVLATYAVVRWLYKRRIRRIEAATPDLLDRLASLNEAGMSVVEGFDRVRGSDLGVLSPEVERIWRDVEFGTKVSDALVRFGRRVRTRAIARVVTLLRSSLRASGQMGEVLRIAADQARADLRMRRQRRQQMLTYLVVIYIAFAVFLVIIVAVNQVLVPSLPQSVPTPNSGQANRLGVDVSQFARFGSVDKGAYTLVFFHTALVQAVCSGFIAGQLGEGTIKDGAKHATGLLVLAYLVFLVISAPVASLAPVDQSSGDQLRLESAELSGGGFVAVHTESINGSRIGTSGYLAPGTHTNVTVPFESPIGSDQELVVVAHRDTNGNRVFDYPGPPWQPNERSVDGPYAPISDTGKPGTSVSLNVTAG